MTLLNGHPAAGRRSGSRSGAGHAPARGGRRARPRSAAAAVLVDISTHYRVGRAHDPDGLDRSSAADVASWYESTGRPSGCADTSRRTAGRSAGAHTSTAITPAACVDGTRRASSDSSTCSMRCRVEHDLRALVDGRRPSSIGCSSSGSSMTTRSTPSSTYGAASAGPSAARAASIEPLRVGRDLGAQRERLEDAGEVVDRDPLGEQALQHPLHLAERQQRRDELVDRGGVDLLDALGEHAHVLAGEQPGGVGGDDRPKVRDEHGDPVDDGGAGELGAVRASRRESTCPRGRTPARRRVPGSWSRWSPSASRRPAGAVPRPTSTPAMLIDVGRRRQLDGVAGAHGRHHDAEVQRRSCGAGHAPGRAGRRVAPDRRGRRGRGRAGSRARARASAP